MVTLVRSKIDQRENRGHQPADELDQAGADEIADALDVAHDARNQDAGFVGVVKGDRQTADVGLHLTAQVGDHFLRGFREELGQSERGEALNDGGAKDAQNDGSQQLDLLLADDIVHEILCGGWQDQSGDPVDGHEQEAQSQQATARMDQRPNVRQRFPSRLFLLSLCTGCFGRIGCHVVARVVGPHGWMPGAFRSLHVA